ncbi:MAG: hypothetical protein HY788_17220 [Deltaproteobacteria bacterium]|nr:hypothetical protein [Deltaproteobacteria bacterium]
MRLFLYILAASNDPDTVECLVPYLVNEEEIFFGPCKRSLRKAFRKQYLKTANDFFLEEEVIIVGVNGSNRHRNRKIVWAGRVVRLMTFETAYEALHGSKYQEMREREDSPLHLKPLYDEGEFQGYAHCSLMHSKLDGWIRDLTHSSNPHVRREGNRLLLVPGTDRHQAFPRDCCFVLDRIFFAQGAGIPISEEMVEVLRRVQPEREGIGDYAIFGQRIDESADGRTGRWLEISGSEAEKLLKQIEEGVPSSPEEKDVKEIRFKSCNCR